MKKLISMLLIAVMLASALFSAVLVSGGEFNSSEIFIDVPADSWFKESVDFVASRGIMGGAGSANTFKPTDLSTRSMVAVILHRLEGEPAAVKASPFTDLSQDWYKAAAEWAYETGVVKGSSDTTFNPDGKVTRQELVTMLYRYAKFCGLNVTDRADSSAFEDGSTVASWALESVEWGLGVGLINGRNDGTKTLLAPMGNSQRSEMATILSRFITKLEAAENTVDPLFDKADALKAVNKCASHKASLHLQLGAPAGVTESAVSYAVTASLGLDPSIYSVTLADGELDALVNAYSAVKNGAFAKADLTFELNNLRTADESVKFTDLSVAVRRNDWAASPCAIECNAAGIKDEMLDAEIGELESLYYCREHGYVHVEASSLSEESFGNAILALMGKSASSYEARVDSKTFSALKSEFDKLASGGMTSVCQVDLALANKNIAKECGYDAQSEIFGVKVSVLKGTGAAAVVECPYDKALRATELFLDKYVCGEHGKAHIELNYTGSAKISDIESLVKTTLDLGGDFTVKVDSTAFTSGKVKVSITHSKGYKIDGPEFVPVYTSGSSSDNAKLLLCENERDAYKLILHDGYSGNTGYGAWNVGQTESGWIIDTRADDSVRHGTIGDISTTAASQVIREVNNTTKGVVNLRTAVTIKNGFDGAMLDFRNDAGESIFRLQTVSGKWQLLQKDGSFVTVYDPEGKTKFVFDLTLDLYEESARIVINDEDCGTYELSAAGVNVNIQSFRFASTDEDKVTFDMDIVDAGVNYALWEYFGAHHFYSALPQGWKYQNAALYSNTGFLSDA
ncbi:MAG: S-layer homology domain-containing protein, partial [Clostridia bacterium]|nr:S-layer homology domain-containing protein [Clostridia bacterium]